MRIQDAKNSRDKEIHRANHLAEYKRQEIRR